MVVFLKYLLWFEYCSLYSAHVLNYFFMCSLFIDWMLCAKFNLNMFYIFPIRHSLFSRICICSVLINYNTGSKNLHGIITIWDFTRTWKGALQLKLLDVDTWGCDNTPFQSSFKLLQSSSSCFQEKFGLICCIKDDKGQLAVPKLISKRGLFV